MNNKIAQNKQQKRLQILSAAQAIFLSEGYLQTSMDKIAMQAKVTKQTVYRYFPAKAELFKAVLEEMGKNVDDSFYKHLNNADTKQALVDFAKAFIQFHLSDSHLATYRLLVAESVHAPEMVKSFMDSGPDSLQATLTQFFSERLAINNSEQLIQFWTGALLSLRSSALLGMDKPSSAEVEAYAKQATELLLAAIK